MSYNSYEILSFDLRIVDTRTTDADRSFDIEIV